MDSFKDFIEILSPAQIPFKPRETSPVGECPTSTPLSSDGGLREGHSATPVPPLGVLKEVLLPMTPSQKGGVKGGFALLGELVIVENGHHNSLYTSFLSLVLPKYNMTINYSQQCELVDELIYFVIAGMETTCRQWSPFRSNQMIEMVKNPQQHPIDVIYCLAIVFDLNFLVIINDHVELHYKEPMMDICKPYLILYQDEIGIYHPCIYHKKSLLTYYEDPIVIQMIQFPGLKEWNQTVYEIQNPKK
jgi:hypothetical protein